MWPNIKQKFGYFSLCIIFLYTKTLLELIERLIYIQNVYLSCKVTTFCVNQIMHFIDKTVLLQHQMHAQIHLFDLDHHFNPKYFSRYHGVNLVPTICWRLVIWCTCPVIRLTSSIRGTGRAWTTGTWSLSGWRRMTPGCTSVRCRLLSNWSTTCS